MKNIFFILTTLVLFTTLNAHATDGSSGMTYYDMVFGNPDQRNAARTSKDGVSVSSESCDGYGGIIGDINSFFCHMEKDMGITGVGSATKTYSTYKVHAEITQTSTTISGVTYDYVGKVWACNSSSADCSQTANFQRVYFIAFSYSKSSGINKGYAVEVPSFFSGQTAGAMEIIYDIGTATTTQTVQAKSIFVSGSTTYKMRVIGQKSSTVLKVNVAGHDGTNGFRFASATAPSTGSSSTSKYFNMYYEAASGIGSNGFFVTDAAGISSAPSTSSGVCFAAAEQGTSMNLSSQTASNCSSYSFAAFDYYSLTANGSPSVQSMTSSSVLGTWQGMASTPTSL